MNIKFDPTLDPKLFVIKETAIFRCKDDPFAAPKCANSNWIEFIKNHYLQDFTLVPLVPRMCPSDTYKIYKSRSSVRIDTTLVGFDQTSNWQRGNRSYIFTGKGNKI